MGCNQVLWIPKSKWQKPYNYDCPILSILFPIGKKSGPWILKLRKTRTKDLIVSLFTATQPTFQIDFYKILYPEAKKGWFTHTWEGVHLSGCSPTNEEKGLLSIQYHTCPHDSSQSCQGLGKYHCAPHQGCKQVFLMVQWPFHSPRKGPNITCLQLGAMPSLSIKSRIWQKIEGSLLGNQ